VPIIGDIMDIMFKCNTKNAILLENYLVKRRKNMLSENPKMSAANAGGGLVTHHQSGGPSTSAVHAPTSNHKKDVQPPPYSKK
jgi:hypothetical protein